MCYCYIYNELNALYVAERYRVQSNTLRILLLVLVEYRNVLNGNHLVCFFGNEYGSINRAWY